MENNILQLPYVYCINERYNNQFKIIYKDKNGKVHITRVLNGKEVEILLNKIRANELTIVK